MRAIARAAAEACTGPPPREFEDLLVELGGHGANRDGDGDERAVRARDHARAGLRRLEGLLPALPIALEHALPLQEQLERLRVGAHEVHELELLDALETGTIALPDHDLDSIRRLLGMQGSAARVRLGLSPNVSRADLENAAQRQLALWEGRAQHPTSTRSERWIAEVLIRTCEDVLTSAE